MFKITTSPQVLPPGCVLNPRPTTPGATFERLVITLQQNYLTTDCGAFIRTLARDMQLQSTSQVQKNKQNMLVVIVSFSSFCRL
jgi:hypothetical protein